MKRIIAISFLIILSFSHLGYYCVYRYQQYKLKEEMEAILFKNISEDSLEVFELEKNEHHIKWEEEGKEFALHGEMYDVAKIKKVNGKTLLYCINDKKEKQLLHDYSKALRSNADHSKSGKNGASFQIPDFLYTVIEKDRHFILLSDKKIFSFNTAFSSSVKEINTPPPKA